MDSWVITSRHRYIFKLRHNLACRGTLHFSVCRRVQNIGNHPLSFKKLTFKHTVIKTVLWYAYLEQWPTAICTSSPKQ